MTNEKIGKFWDTHDFTDFDNPDSPDVEFEINGAVPIEIELFSALETLVNLWLQQKLDEQVYNR